MFEGGSLEFQTDLNFSLKGHFKGRLLDLNPILTQTSSFCNMEHERVFHYVLLSIGLPFLAAAPSTYVYDYVHHGGGWRLSTLARGT